MSIVRPWASYASQEKTRLGMADLISLKQRGLSVKLLIAGACLSLAEHVQSPTQKPTGNVTVVHFYHCMQACN